MADIPTARELLEVLRSPSRLPAIRARFDQSPTKEAIVRLGRDVVDPQLLRVVLGPELAPVWLPPLEALYRRVRAVHPAHFHEVDAVWRRQRSVWHSLLRFRDRAVPAASAPGSPPPPSAASPGGPPAAPDRSPSRGSARPLPVLTLADPESPNGPSSSFFTGAGYGTAGVLQLLHALLESPEAVEKFHRQWVSSRGPSSDWDGWVFPSDLATFAAERRARGGSVT